VPLAPSSQAKLKTADGTRVIKVSTQLDPCDEFAVESGRVRLFYSTDGSRLQYQDCGTFELCHPPAGALAFLDAIIHRYIPVDARSRGAHSSIEAPQFPWGQILDPNNLSGTFPALPEKQYWRIEIWDIKAQELVFDQLGQGAIVLNPSTVIMRGREYEWVFISADRTAHNTFQLLSESETIVIQSHFPTEKPANSATANVEVERGVRLVNAYLKEGLYYEASKLWLTIVGASAQAP
jgi:hypothetical protein